MQKSEFLKALSDMWKDFDSRVLRYKAFDILLDFQVSSVTLFILLVFLVQRARGVDTSTSAALCRTKEFGYAANYSANGSHDCRVTGACFSLNQDKNDFELVTLPALLPVLSSAGGETLLLLVKHAELIIDKSNIRLPAADDQEEKKDPKLHRCGSLGVRSKTSSEHLVSHVLPMLLRAYDDNDPRIQEEVLRKSVILGRQLDTQLVKQVILPRVHGLALKTTIAAVRVSALLCLGDFVNTLDRQAVLDVLQTIQRCTAVDHSAPTLMCTLGVSNSILKQYGVEFAAEHILPLLTPLLTAQQLNVQQFAKYMLFVKDILRRIEENRGVTVTDSGVPDVKPATTANGLQSQVLSKANGTVASAKSSPAWDEDWGPTARATANASHTAHQPPKDNLSFHSILGDQSIQSAPTQSQSSLISTVSSQQTSNSCPAVDIEWPPRPSSGVTVESGIGEKQLNAGTSLSSNFEDLDPFANWPPRPSASSNDSGTFNNGIMGGPGMNNYGFSSITSTPGIMNHPTESSSNSWGFSNQNSGEILRPNHGSSTSNTGILNGGSSQSSIGFLKQNRGISASMSSYNNQKSADLGSIFGSSKNEQTAPKLAPP
ncbi:hypothetical protein Gohar_024451, partial [Gossypium harknessii]|nr:hypothetical protein [Gossypium harknessii]